MDFLIKGTNTGNCPFPTSSVKVDGMTGVKISTFQSWGKDRYFRYPVLITFNCWIQSFYVRKQILMCLTTVYVISVTCSPKDFLIQNPSELHVCLCLGEGGRYSHWIFGRKTPMKTKIFPIVALIMCCVLTVCMY